MGRGIIIFIIICMILSPYAFDTSTAHEVGNKQGSGDATPLGDVEVAITLDAGTPTTDAIVDNRPLSDYPAVVFIVSTEAKGELSAMTTTAILCYTIVAANGTYMWQGSNKGWADFDRLHYTIKASGDKNGLTSVMVEQYMLGEKTETPVYVRQVVGVGV